MSFGTHSELLARVGRVRDEAVLLLDALYAQYPELRPSSEGVKGWGDGLQWGADDWTGDWEAFKAQREYHRGKTTARTNSGSFAPYSAEAHLLKLLDANMHLTVQNRREYAESIYRVVANMPPAARKAIVQEVKGIMAFDSMQELRAFASNLFSEEDSTTKAAWDSTFKLLILDSGSEGPFDPHHESRHEVRDGLYAHELTHAIDTSYEPSLSDTPEWRAAHEEEFQRVSSGISERAKKFPREAFAEMGRLLYSGKKIAENTEFCKENMPKCYAIFNGRRFTMKQNTESGEVKNDEVEKVALALTDEELKHMTPERLLELCPDPAANRARFHVLKLTDDDINEWIKGLPLDSDNFETGTFDDVAPDSTTVGEAEVPEAPAEDA